MVKMLRNIQEIHMLMRVFLIPGGSHGIASAALDAPRGVLRRAALTNVVKACGNLVQGQKQKEHQ